MPQGRIENLINKNVKGGKPAILGISVLGPKQQVKRFFGEAQAWGRNAKILVATEIFWAIPMMWIFFYQTIFMREIGIDEVLIGLSMTLPLIFQVFFPMLGGYLADRFGRKRVIMFFDIVGWIGYPGTLFIAREFWQIIVAMTFQGLASTIFGVWQTYLIEDTKSRHRVSVFGFMRIVSIVASLLTPMAGALISNYGVEQGCRYIFLTSVVSNTIMFLIRQILLRESEIGKILSSDNEISRPKSYIETLGIVAKHRDLLLLFTLSILGSMSGRLTVTFGPLYLTDLNTLALNESIASIIPMASSISSLVALSFIVPKLKQSNVRKALLISYAIGFLGIIVLIIAPTGSMLLAVLSAVFDSARYLAAFSILPVFLVNAIDEVDPFTKAKIMSLITTFSALVSWPIPAFGGYLYTIEPTYPFLFAAISLLICEGLLLPARANMTS